MSAPEATNQKPEIVFRPALHRFAVAFVVTTFCMVVLGGTVTSRGVGMSVPDWPTSYHYNMFLFPTSMWVGGIFYEHTHRLLGTVVGLLSIAVAVWLAMTGRGRRWLVYFGVATLVMVILQGVMGGLRVTEKSTLLAVFHGVAGQVFFCMTVVIAAATSRWWVATSSGTAFPGGVGAQTPGGSPVPSMRPLRILSLVLLVVLMVQLVLGAAIRHTHSALAIPDFPSSYGHVVPPLDESSIKAAESQIPYDQVNGDFTGSYTPAQVGVHFAHRAWAIVVVGMIVWVATRVSQLSNEPAIRLPALVLMLLALVQVGLGASVIWTGHHPEVATAHQAVGAVILATALLLSLRLHHAGDSAALPANAAAHASEHGADAADFSATGHSLSASPLQGARA